MLAGELKAQYLKPKKEDKVGVIAIGKDFWYHVQDNEEVPGDLDIALHPRPELNG